MIKKPQLNPEPYLFSYFEGGLKPSKSAHKSRFFKVKKIDCSVFLILKKRFL